jgi:uncharacterized repeat protein (TIGR03809 family)
MTHRTDVARGRDFGAHWCALAERRLDYLTELFETGRWRRYYSEVAFLENIREAKATVEIWRDLSTREASRNNSGIGMSWLGRARAAPPRGDGLQVHRLQAQLAEIPAEPPRREVSIAIEAKNVRSDTFPAPEPDAPALDPALNAVSQLALDIVTMQERYPLLRNAM